MGYLSLVLFTVLCVISISHAKQVTIQIGIDGWFWRDLVDKKLPEDAFPAGIDKKGEKVYVGEVTYYGGAGSVLTGGYVPSEQQLFFEYGKKQLTADNYIKILSSQRPENFQWFSVKKDQKAAQENFIYVPGGQDKTNPLAIGRIKIDKEIIVGKVVVINGVFEYINYNRNGIGIAATEYEVLYYKTNPKDSEIQITIN